MTSTHRILIASLVAAGFVAAAVPASADRVNEIVIVTGAVTDTSSASKAESRSDSSIPMLPVVYDDAGS